jgi:lysozyme
VKTSQQGLDLIKRYETFVSHPYMPTPNDVPTIGYGTTVYPNGKRVSMNDAAISEAKAVEYLAHDVEECERDVAQAVRVPLSQGQFDALVSFIYNIGEPNFDSSTMVKLLNAGDYEGAANQFPRWNKQKGRVLNGLTRRRAEEQALFRTGK